MNANLNVVRQHGSFEPVEDKLRTIFLNDFHDMLVLGQGQVTTAHPTVPEDYIFVCCSNYPAYIDDLKQCREIITVLESYDNPTAVAEAEICEFRQATADLLRGRKLKKGDVVSVQSGHFENLKGIVLDQYREGYYSVLFRLFTKTLTRILPAEQLHYEQSIFSLLKQPILSVGGHLPPMNSVASHARAAYRRTLKREGKLYWPRNRNPEQ